MNQDKTGGPAFPYPVCTAEGYPGQNAAGGMSLRDYFAAAALSGLASRLIDSDGFPAGLGTVKTSMAALSYGLADAMLKQREATP